jgi:Ca2+-binding EF-hand superfamily protein
MDPRLLLIAMMFSTPPAEAQSSTWFRRLDTNNDGYLQRAEVSRLRAVSEAFDEADANRDGKLDPGEFITAETIAHARKLPGFPQDVDTAEKIRAELERDPDLKTIQVRAHRGRVRLSGTVSDEAHRASAVRTAAGIAGAANVGDTITLR